MKYRIEALDEIPCGIVFTATPVWIGNEFFRFWC